MIYCDRLQGGDSMAISESKTRTLVTLDKELKKKLEELAEKENRSFSNYVETILKNHVDKVISQ